MAGFNYNTPASGQNFVGRQLEVGAFGNLLKAGEHIVIYDAPKTGKTSLIQNSLQKLKGEGFPFIPASASFLNCRTIEDMVQELGDAILKAVALTPDEFEDIIGRYLGPEGFSFNQESYQVTGRVLSFDRPLVTADFKRVISLAFALASEKGGRIILCIDNFQNIIFADEGPDCCRAMAELMRESEKGNCAIVISGSRLNAMKEIFEQHSWFNHAVERIPLREVESNLIIDYAVKELLVGGKVVERDLLLGMCKLFRGNMWYINAFCSICDYLSRGYIMEPILEDALRRMLSSHEVRFCAMMSDLTTFQVNLLRAIVEGNTKFSSTEVIEHYKLNSSANVRRLKEALTKKEIVTFDENDNPQIIDPLFEYWVTNKYFKIKG